MDIKELLLQSQIGTVDGISLQDPKKLSQWLTIGENIYPRDTGSIFTGNVGSIDVIIKTDYDYHCLRYEYLVGLEVNKLESPNFIKTFALFLMTNPEKGYIPYLVLEKVRGIAFRDFKAKFDHLNNIALQLALALQHAQDLIDFTHYDLHLENVMYVALPQQTSLQYKIREKIYTIETDYILKIIGLKSGGNYCETSITEIFRHLI